MSAHAPERRVFMALGGPRHLHGLPMQGDAQHGERLIVTAVPEGRRDHDPADVHVYELSGDLLLYVGE